MSAGAEPPPLCHPPGHRAQHTQPTGHEGHPDLHSPGGGEEKQVQQFDGVGGPRVTCHGVLDGDRSLHGSQVTPNSALSCGCCCHLAARRANAVQVCKPACSGKALELAQPRSSLTTTHPGLQSRCSNPWYLRGRALCQHLGTRWLGWTFGEVQPTPRLTPGSRDRQKVNKEGKRKAVTNTPAIEEAGGSPLFKNYSSFCTV